MKENEKALKQARAYYKRADLEITEQLDHLGLHIAKMYITVPMGLQIAHWIVRYNKLALHISHSKMAGADNYVMSGFKNFEEEKPKEEQFYQDTNKDKLFDKIEELIAEQQKQ